MSGCIGRRLLALGVLSVALCPAWLGHCQQAIASGVPGVLTRFQLPAGSAPEGITVGPDGHLWFTEPGSNRIGRLSVDGQLTEFPLPSSEIGLPHQIVAGPDGNLWFTQGGGVGRISPDGAVKQFQTHEQLSGITPGPDGAVWVSAGQQLIRISGSGDISTIGFYAEEILAQAVTDGPDGNLWVAEEKGDPFGFGARLIGQITRVTPAGTRTSYPIPSVPELFRPFAITTGPDGDIWYSGADVGHIDPYDGTMSRVELPLGWESGAITAGADGNVWFNKRGAAAVGRVTPDGLFSRVKTGSPVAGITTGPDGDIWVTAQSADQIARLVPGRPGVEVSSEKARVRHGRTRVALACSGGAVDGHCSGEVQLVQRLRDVEAGKTKITFLVFGQATYSLPSEKTGTMGIRITKRGLRYLKDHRGARLYAIARATAGEGFSRRILLWRAKRAGEPSK